MKLTLLDRVVILSDLLPKFGTKEEIGVVLSLTPKIALSEGEKSILADEKNEDGTRTITVKNEALAALEKEVSFTDDELLLLKSRVEHIDRNGLFTAGNYPLYMCIWAEPLTENSNESLTDIPDEKQTPPVDDPAL